MSRTSRGYTNKKKKKTDYVTEHKDRTYLTYQVTEYENTVDKIKNSDYKYDRKGKQKKSNICTTYYLTKDHRRKNQT